MCSAFEARDRFSAPGLSRVVGSGLGASGLPLSVVQLRNFLFAEDFYGPFLPVLCGLWPGNISWTNLLGVRDVLRCGELAVRAAEEETVEQ